MQTSTQQPAQPRPEYPRPILQRRQWLNLNGDWEFEFDPEDIGLTERWFENRSFSRSIVVPFPVESSASGINEPSTDVIWYQRVFTNPGWSGKQVLLNVGACDYETCVFINGLSVGEHRGGYAPFSFDITHALEEGENRITIRVRDSNSWQQPRGKQAGTSRWPIDYDPVTGIWQTVWLEPVEHVHITGLATSYSLNDQSLSVTATLSQPCRGQLSATLKTGDVVVGHATSEIPKRSEAKCNLTVDAPELWAPGSPNLYDLHVEITDSSEVVIDAVESYAGLREISIQDGRLLLNGRPIHLRGILDQGYFPEGWYTAIDDRAIKRDVELTLAMGFNLARKHQKAEDPRYLYWADQLGLLVWAEMPSGRIFSTQLIDSLTREWIALIQRDRAHPSVITWVPFNESWGVWHIASRPEQRAFVDAMVSLTKTLDQSRPVVGNDGWEYTSGDLWTLHLYEEGSIKNRLSEVIADPSSQIADIGRKRVGALENADVEGLPILLTECGGIGFLPSGYTGDTFAYGALPETAEELALRIRETMAKLRASVHLQGYVWTQLTDVQQEINGLLYFDRTPKIPLEKLRGIFLDIEENPNSDAR